MKIFIWTGCRLDEEIETGHSGPDVHLDLSAKVGYVEVEDEDRIFEWNNS